MTDAFIGIGSNLDDPARQVAQAIASLQQLPQTTFKAISSLYRSRAVGPGQQPDYVNAVAWLSCELPPELLLTQLQQIEHQQGRVRTERWGPRTLDLDILLYGETCRQSERLTLPHPRLTERNFVLYPLADLVEDWRLPDGSYLREHLARVGREGLVRLNSRPTDAALTETPWSN